MKKFYTLILGLLLLNSCIPIRIAPSISDYKLTKGKRFKKGLPKTTTFVFEDPKDAGQFYSYVNTKFYLEDYYVDVEVPFKVDGREYFFSFYEVEIPTKTISLFPLVFDVAANATLQNEDFETYATKEDTTLLKKGFWYIAIEVFSKEEKDCLHEDSISRDKVLPYLRAMKEEYLSTHNYNEVVFKN
ncbi:hypothetical protein MTsPCn9_15540 [Croceitalea sp. MTPC9]|uniref:hypothetical protein n=1 Tax=unclassified Croceitalea TaxID=2632280 RepID=UPI002B3C2394|nr:hypothetical protein MTsPCn6_13590 [Croceitalea sp. MTPC6]GMN16618.1 hypothetical protein MTsPCn9_15540 [Croceitalea sp. MTPC9]